jgi:hypothetical protein
MKILLMILLMMSPYIIEVGIETYYELKKNVSLSHFISAGVRGLLMVIIGALFMKQGWSQSWWEPVILMMVIHFAFFNYTYNWITGRKWNYLRKKGIDKYIAEIPVLALMFLQLWMLVLGVVVIIKF